MYSFSDQPPITPQLLLIVGTPVSKLPVIPATWAYGVLLQKLLYVQDGVFTMRIFVQVVYVCLCVRMCVFVCNLSFN